MNTAVVETEEEDNTSNVAAGVRAAALGRNNGVWGGRRREAQMDGLREAWHPSTRMQAARAGEGRRTGARGEGRRTGGARRGKGKTRARDCGAVASRGISLRSFLFIF